MADERLGQAVRQKDAMEQLLKSEGWKMLQGYIHQQVETQRNTIISQRLGKTRVTTQDGGIREVDITSLTQEFDKGIIHGQMHVLNFPSMLLNDSKVTAMSLSNRGDPDDPSEQLQDTKEASDE